MKGGAAMTKRIMQVAALWLMAGLAFAQANSIPSQPHLLVKGQASRTVMPDRFTVELLLQATDASPDKARQIVQTNAANVLALLSKHNAVPDSVSASSLSIEPDRAYENGKSVFKGTRVTRRLRGTFDALGGLQAMLAALDTSPELQVTSLRSTYSQGGRLRAELKREAAQQSRRTADGLASAYGTRIIGLYTISDVAPDFAYGVRAGVWDTRESDDQPAPPAPPAAQPAIGGTVDVTGSRAASESLQAGAITYSENVYAIFLIAP
jgi:uncharacterized protein YggE